MFCVIIVFLQTLKESKFFKFFRAQTFKNTSVSNDPDSLKNKITKDLKKSALQIA